MHLWWRQQTVIATCFAALVAGGGTSLALADEELPLSAGETRLDNVLPQSVLDNLSVPDEPVRIASKPKLDWRRGLANQAKNAPTEEKPETTTAQIVSKQNSGKSVDEDNAPPALPNKLTPYKVATRGPSLKAPAMATNPSESEASSKDSVAGIKKGEKPDSISTKPKRLPVSSSVNAKAIEDAGVDSAKKPKAGTVEEEVAEETTEGSVSKIVEKAPPEPLTRGLRNLRSRLRTVLSHYYRRPLNNVEHDPWEVMHSMLSFELHSRVQDRTRRGSYITAVGHLCFNRPCKGQRLMRLNKEGKLDAPIGVGLQGHKGQFLAMLAQCNVSPDYPIRVSGKEFTIHDLIAAEQKTCYAGEELTFKLIGLGHYLDSDATWLNDKGESWSIPRLIAEERKQPIRGAACGGTHRLGGLGLAVRRREARNEPLDGEFKEASTFIEQYLNYAWRLQNSDGSMSTQWFRGPGADDDLERRIRTSGHTVEWLAYSVPDSELRSQRMVRAVNYLTNLLAHNSDKDWHLGSLGHAVHALVLYDKRVFRPHDSEEMLELATVDPKSSYFRGYKIYRNVLRRTPPQSSGFLGLFGSSRTSKSR